MKCYICRQARADGLPWPKRLYRYTSWDGMPAALGEHLCEACWQEQERAITDAVAAQQGAA